MPVSIAYKALSQSLAALPPPRQLVVALSGGRDSVSLLHACLFWLREQAAQSISVGADLATPSLADQSLRPLDSSSASRLTALRAIHVNHHLQEAADSFEQHCRSLCELLDVPLAVLHVNAAASKGQSPEAAAREARYAALVEHVQVDEYLLLAQHQRDQAETFLLQALRGAGSRGLAGMAAQQKLEHISVVRPWLDVPHQAIVDYCTTQQLPFIDDPSNHDTRYRRNALRHDCFPVLQSVFPGAETTLARSAALSAEAQQLMHELASLDAETVFDLERRCLSIAGLLRLSPARQRNLLRWYFEFMQVDMPSRVKLDAIQQGLHEKSSDHFSQQWSDCELHCYRQRLFITPRLPVFWHWVTDDDIWHFDDIASVQMSRDKDSDSLRMTALTQHPFIQLPLRPRKSPKQLAQTLGIAPWLRASVPLLWLNDELIAVGNYWHNVKSPIQPIWQGWLPDIWRRSAGTD